MTDSEESEAQRLERLASLMEDTEALMHSSAEVIPEPKRSRMHERADALSARAKTHWDVAKRLRKS